jgi:hypothetical protein
MREPNREVVLATRVSYSCEIIQELGAADP